MHLALVTQYNTEALNTESFTHARTHCVIVSVHSITESTRTLASISLTAEPPGSYYHHDNTK